MFQMMGVFAEFERSMIRERVLAGMSRAAANGTNSGKTIGRPRIGAETEANIRAALQKGGMGMRKVAVQFGVATGIQRHEIFGLTELAPRSIISDGGADV
jgi:DNA invertase Pin-like site-specific DNA recombinase